MVFRQVSRLPFEVVPLRHRLYACSPCYAYGATATPVTNEEGPMILAFR